MRLRPMADQAPAGTQSCFSPRATIFNASSGSGRCSFIASGAGAVNQTSIFAELIGKPRRDHARAGLVGVR